jgi:4-hydroxy-3-methylbut-2-enyl diphosphate reductase
MVPARPGNEIVHNRHVIRELQEQSAVFVEHLSDIPTGAVAIFSAHGVSRAIEEQAAELGLRTKDTMWPSSAIMIILKWRGLPEESMGMSIS